MDEKEAAEEEIKKIVTNQSQNKKKRKSSTTQKNIKQQQQPVNINVPLPFIEHLYNVLLTANSRSRWEPHELVPVGQSIQQLRNILIRNGVIQPSQPSQPAQQLQQRPQQQQQQQQQQPQNVD